MGTPDHELSWSDGGIIAGATLGVCPRGGVLEGVDHWRTGCHTLACLSPCTIG